MRRCPEGGQRVLWAHDREERLHRGGMGTDSAGAPRRWDGDLLGRPRRSDQLAKETTASLKSATNPPSREQLLTDIALDIQSMAQERQNPLTDFKPTSGSDPRQQILEELRSVSEIVSSKAATDETAAFKEWLVTSAQAAADAAKEGGFL